jgi:hypothetical protein
MVERQYTSESTGSDLSPESSWGRDGRGDVTRVIGGLNRAKGGGRAPLHSASWATEHTRESGVSSLRVLSYLWRNPPEYIEEHLGNNPNIFIP